MRITEIGDESLTFDNGCVLMSVHEQDCCEWHWLDFSVMKTYNVSTVTGKTIDIYQQEFDFTNGVPFDRVEDLGILLYDSEGNKYLIPGHGSNNGYYSTDIELVYVNEDGYRIFEYDVSECQKIDD